MKPIIIEDNIFGFEPCEEDGSVLLAEELHGEVLLMSCKNCII